MKCIVLTSPINCWMILIIYWISIHLRLSNPSKYWSKCWEISDPSLHSKCLLSQTLQSEYSSHCKSQRYVSLESIHFQAWMFEEFCWCDQQWLTWGQPFLAYLEAITRKSRTLRVVQTVAHDKHFGWKISTPTIRWLSLLCQRHYSEYRNDNQSNIQSFWRRRNVISL